MENGETKFFQAITGSAIDAEAGIIKGVSVITSGVEAIGHKISIDDTTLAQLKQCADAFEGGIRVKMDHQSGVGSIVGVLKNFSIAGNKLIADLHLLKAHEAYAKIIEMASAIPESFGLSVVFSGTFETVDKTSYARCSELYSVDLVDTPAANPNGLFSANVDTPKQDMKFEDFIAKAKAVFGSEPEAPINFEAKFTEADGKLTELSTKFSKLEGELKTANEEVTKLKASQSEFDAKVELAASKKAVDIAAAVGVPAIPNKPAGNPGTKADNSKTLAEFKALPHAERNEFIRNGGKIAN